MKKLLLPLLIASTLSSPVLIAADFSENIKQAMSADIRTDKEKDRDRNRKPVETLKFFGIKDDMKVLELVPGGGWYSKLLAPALRDNGQFYLSLGTKNLKDSLLKNAAFDKVKLVGSEEYDFINLNFNVNDLDAVLTFRNYHNFDEAERISVNKAAFKALKPGGVYGVVDHTRRHMQKNNDENGRRFDPVFAIKEIQQAGFVLVDYSNLHYRADDELRFEVGRKTIRGNSDRFTLLFKKPE
ncbi:class I SAM-dependent methyltransferase [Colwellia sp. 12G3]|uniref:class I SAM-dependent methyltransferase n=1 Tax=Colwellia sp. 12G3 TaxID=2058299 RepID=UPI000C328BA6|nr:class I SAM-dependent methyltransferase [Colwellia sp. 12G3]PKI14876.1 methyltransferase [Colwellia sp. 12G3]